MTEKTNNLWKLLYFGHCCLYVHICHLTITTLLMKYYHHNFTQHVRFWKGQLSCPCPLSRLRGRSQGTKLRDWLQDPRLMNILCDFRTLNKESLSSAFFIGFNHNRRLLWVWTQMPMDISCVSEYIKEYELSSKNGVQWFVSWARTVHSANI